MRDKNLISILEQLQQVFKLQKLEIDSKTKNQFKTTETNRYRLKAKRLQQLCFFIFFFSKND